MQRDSEAFIELITGAQTPLYGYIVSLCHDHAAAKDILQETNLTLWRKAETFEAGTHFTAWACKIAYFHVLNHRRKLKREVLIFDDDVFDYLAERQEERAGLLETHGDALRQCLRKLPADHQQLIERRYQSGGSVKRIAEEDGKTEGAISQALFRIRALLQRCVESTLAKTEPA